MIYELHIYPVAITSVIVGTGFILFMLEWDD